MEERRQHLRVKVQFETIYGLFQKDNKKVSTVQKGEILNISLGGFMLETDEDALSIGDNIYFKFHDFVDGESVKIQGRGDVVWARENMIGIRFSSIDAEFYQYIRNLVKEAEDEAEED